MEIENLGIAVDLPAGWDGVIYAYEDSGNLAVTRLASFGIPSGDDDIGSLAMGTMSGADLLLVLLEWERPPDLVDPDDWGVFTPVDLISVSAEDSVEGMDGVPTRLGLLASLFSMSSRFFQLRVASGSESISNEQMDAANSLLAGVTIGPA
jgi:hypothetical protein